MYRKACSPEHEPFGRWFDFNDSRVEGIPITKIATQYAGKSECAYMAIYRRRNLTKKQFNCAVPEHLKTQVCYVKSLLVLLGEIESQSSKYVTATPPFNSLRTFTKAPTISPFFHSRKAFWLVTKDLGFVSLEPTGAVLKTTCPISRF